ncbi:hypothetical protein BDZ91DRAFT_652445 [Kalaharituber pfeilii]|nr:hypothetical protein BDZ91DRAFT_652445 [Kalaharituber pfeilii]
MSLQKSYLRFLSSPKASALTKSTAGLHYITTAQSVSGESIISHLNSQNNQLEKKSENVLSAFETQDSLVLETETTIEFKTSGGFYLPGLDDNFLADQTATFVLIHVVTFIDGHISQIRLYWDQGTLLKQMGVIGRTGRNWPIKEGHEQSKVVQLSASKVTLTSSSIEATPQTRDRGVSNASNSSTASIRPTPDPHSTLSLFTPREPEPETFNKPAVIPPRNSAKPPPRDLSELFVSSDNESTSTKGGKTDEAVPPRAPAQYNRGRSYNFLDESGEDGATQQQLQDSVKVNPQKYAHFDFGDEAPEVPPALAPVKESRNKASWDFADFSTPEKRPVRIRPDGVRHFSWGDDDETIAARGSVTGAQSNANARLEAQSHAKRDAQSHFVIADESPAKPYSAAKVSTADRKAALKDMDSNLGCDVEQLGGGGRTIYKTRGDGMGGRKVIDDDEPIKSVPKVVPKVTRIEKSQEDDVDRKPAQVEQLAGGNRTIYKTTGDGMGGRKGTSSFWDFTEEEDKKENQRTSNVPVRKDTQPSSFWDF